MEHNMGQGSGYGAGTGTMEQQREQMRDQARETGERAFDRGQQVMEQVEGIPANVYYGAVLGSIGVSALLFLMGKRNLGVFVGLWPPTLLNLALFTKQLKPSHEMGEARDRMQHM
jgi:hypothetical protein